MLSRRDLTAFTAGRHRRIHDVLGAHPTESGTDFAVWAPSARSVSVVGDFNDWRSLLPAPFGSSVGRIPFALKEVLLFQGEARGGEADEQECFAAAGRPFALRGVEADDYVLCFFHDRLFRAEAVLRLARDTPPETFGRWCEEWLSGLTQTERGAEHCAGRDQDTRFEATLTYDTEIAGPLVTVVVADQPTRELYEQRQQQRAEKNPSPPGP